jgi:glycosyltransferase involved in cell wall biosynthesis
VAETDALRLAVVTPWFGPALAGGAERSAWQVVHGLTARGHHVEVFTTSARSLASDWSTAAYAPGTHVEDGVSVRRFLVDARNPERFERANRILLGRPLAYYRQHAQALEPEIADDFVSEGINASAAVAALAERARDFDAVLVLPYLYGLCLAAIEAVGERAILQPCLHDEPYAYLPQIERAFRSAALVAFNSPAEHRLAVERYGPAIALKARVVGQWVDDAPLTGHAVERIGTFRPAQRRYALYLGRRETTKNVDLLVESFATFRRRQRMSTLELVLIGEGRRSFDDRRHGIVDLGFVDEAQKAALLAHATAVVQPSVNESFSRAVMEGWRAGKPAIVNARCGATADAVRLSGGGWSATTKAEWTAAFERLDTLADAQRDAAGEDGRRYVVEQTAREKILDRFEGAIRAVREGVRRTRFDAVPAVTLARRLGDGARTILFAGPLVASACLDQLLAGFAFLLSFGLDARLVVLGTFPPGEGVADRFYEAVARANLAERVVVVAPDRPDVVAACYRSSELFWSMAEGGSERELIDALGFGVPALVFASAAAREVLGPSGMLFGDKRDPRALAGVAALLLGDAALRALLREGQYRRFEALREAGELELAG